MASLQGDFGELKFTVNVTRAETGKVETHELVSIISKEQAESIGVNFDSETKEK
jgi:hypothetical protein